MRLDLNFFRAALTIALFAFSGCSGTPDDKKISSIIGGFKWSGFYTFSMELDGIKAYFDPNPAEILKPLGKADYYKAGIIFITHDNSHLGDADVKSMLEVLTNSLTIIVMPVQEALYLTNRNSGFNVMGLLPGESGRIGELHIQTVPAYDTILKLIAVADHPRSNNWLGYIISTGGIRIYYTGASQLIPEMRGIRCDILIANIYLKPDDMSGLVTLAQWTGAKAVIPVGYAPNGAYTEQLEQVKKVLSGRCSVIMPEIDTAEETLFDAAAKGDIEFIKNYQGNVNSMNNYGWTAIITAAYYGQTDSIKALIAAGADVKTADKEGNTVLMIASQYGHTAAVKVLIAAGSDVNAAHENGWMPLMRPAEAASNHPGGGTALMNAARFGHTDTVKALIDAGADVNAVRFDGKTALMEAAYYGFTGTVTALIKAGANVSMTDHYGRTALIYAAYNKHIDTVKVLKDAGGK